MYSTTQNCFTVFSQIRLCAAILLAWSITGAFDPVHLFNLPQENRSPSSSTAGKDIPSYRSKSDSLPRYRDDGDAYQYRGIEQKIWRHAFKHALFYENGQPSDSLTFRQRHQNLFASSKFEDIKNSGHQKVRVLESNGLKSHMIWDSLQGREPGLVYVRPMYFDPTHQSEFTVTDKVLIKFRKPIAKAELKAWMSKFDLEWKVNLSGNMMQFKLRDPNLDPMVVTHRLSSSAEVEWAEPEMLFEPKRFFEPNDPGYPRQQHLRNSGQQGGLAGADVRADSAWDLTQGDTTIVIAIIDDGVQTDHPDLHIAPGGRNYVAAPPTNDPNPVDKIDNHGTAVAGVAAAIGNNGIGVSGMAPKARILPIKILEGKSVASTQAIGDAIRYAADAGADILSNSWGNGSTSNYINEAIIYASTQGRNGLGCPVFFASGNYGTEFKSINFNAPAGNYYVSFQYSKNASGSSGEDLAAIDNVSIKTDDRYTIKYQETFSTGLPSGWTTPNPPGGVGWSATSEMFLNGLGDRVSLRSGILSDNQTSQILMPLRTYVDGDEVQVKYKVSSEAKGDYFEVGSCSPDKSECQYFNDTATTGILTRSNIISYPALADSSIVVGSSTDHDFRSDYSQYDIAGTGKTVDFLASSDGGWNRVTTIDRTGAAGYSNGDVTSEFGGTSSATPLVSGIAALILSKNPNLTRNEVLAILRSTANKVGDRAYTGGWNTEYGWGRVNAYQALLATPPLLPPSPPVLALPTLGTKDQALTPTLIWNPVVDALSYGLQVATDIGFTDLVVDISGITAISKSIGPLEHATPYYWRVNASNTKGASEWSSKWSFTTILPVDHAPIVNAKKDTTVKEGQNLNFTVIGSDVDGDVVTLSALNLPTGATFNPSTGLFNWTPGYNQAAIFNIQFRGQSGSPALADTDTVIVTVNNVDRSPIVNAGPNLIVDENQIMTFTVTNSDLDGDSVSVSLLNAPKGSIFNSATGVFTWKPTFSQSGIYSLYFHGESGNPILFTNDTIEVKVRDIGTGLGTIRLVSGLTNPGTAFLAMPAGSSDGFLLGMDSIDVFDLNPGWYGFAAYREGYRVAHFSIQAKMDTLATKRFNSRPSIPIRFLGPDTIQVDGLPFSIQDSSTLAQCDLNADGLEDLVIFNPKGISVFLNADSTSRIGLQFTKATHAFFPGLNTKIHSAFFSDWNADGYYDLIAADETGNIFACMGDESVFGPPQILITRTGEKLFVLVEDWNFDGRPDVWVYSQGKGLFVYSNSGTAGNPSLNPTPIQIATQGGAALLGLSGLILLDINGDGIKDIVAEINGRLGYRTLQYQGGYSNAADSSQLLNIGGDDHPCSNCMLSAKIPENGMPRLYLGEPGKPIISHDSWLMGDLNGDQTVDVLDLGILSDAWELKDTDSRWEPFFNLNVKTGNESIDVLDLSILSDAWEMKE